MEPVCEQNIVHEDAIAHARKQMPETGTIQSLAEFFKAFGDPTRVSILCALLASELCVCDLASLLGMSQSAVSHQLRVLKAARLVKYRREGRSVYYGLDDDHVGLIVAQGVRHISE